MTMSSLKFACLVLLFIAFATARAAEEVVFRDDFAGTSLHPAWQLIAPDSDRWALVDGEHLLMVMEAKGKNVLQLKETLPENFVIVAKFDNPPQYSDQIVGMTLGDPSGDNVRVGYYPDAGGYARPYFHKTLHGKVSEIKRKLNRPIPSTDSLLLSLRKQGVEYFGAFSVDGATWTQIGVQVLFKVEKRLSIEAYAQRGPESPIRLDFVEIRKLNK